jgi:hypothetical protein
MNLTEAVIKQIELALETREKGELARAAKTLELEAQGFRIVNGGSVIAGRREDGESILRYAYTDQRTGELLHEGEDDLIGEDGEDWPDNWYHADHLWDDLEWSEPLEDLPEWLSDMLISETNENPDEMRAWMEKLVAEPKG